MFLIRSNMPSIATVKPYTPLELYGRDIYVAEGCYNCHSQMIRPLVVGDAALRRLLQAGRVRCTTTRSSGAADGSGPDLAREGGREEPGRVARAALRATRRLGGARVRSCPRTRGCWQEIDWGSVKRSGAMR